MTPSGQRHAIVVICRDPFDVERIREWLSESATVEVVADCLSLSESVGVIQRRNPDLLLIDVQLLRPVVIRNLAYSSLRPRITFLQPMSVESGPEGCERVANTSLADRKLFRRCIEVTAQDAATAPRVSTERVLTLLNGREFRRRRPLLFQAGPSIMPIDHDEVDWLEQDGDRTVLHGSEQRVLELPTNEVLRELRRRREVFVSISDYAAVNISKVRQVSIAENGSGTVVLQGDIRKTVEGPHMPALLRTLMRVFSLARIYSGAATNFNPQSATQ